jgi:integrase
MNSTSTRKVWNKGKVVGQRRPFTREQVALLEQLLVAATPTDKMAVRNLALLRTGIDTMLRVSDLLRLTVGQLRSNGRIVDQFELTQKKTKKPIRCNLTPFTRDALGKWLEVGGLYSHSLVVFDFGSRQYARIIKGWAEMIHLDPSLYSTHSVRRTKAREIYRTTQNLEAIKTLLGHTSLNATQYYLGVTQEDADEIARNTRI